MDLDVKVVNQECLVLLWKSYKYLILLFCFVNNDWENNFTAVQNGIVNDYAAANFERDVSSSSFDITHLAGSFSYGPQQLLEETSLDIQYDNFYQPENSYGLFDLVGIDESLGVIGVLKGSEDSYEEEELFSVLGILVRYPGDEPETVVYFGKHDGVFPQTSNESEWDEPWGTQMAKGREALDKFYNIDPDDLLNRSGLQQRKELDRSTRIPPQNFVESDAKSTIYNLD